MSDKKNPEPRVNNKFLVKSKKNVTERIRTWLEIYRQDLRIVSEILAKWIQEMFRSHGAGGGGEVDSG
jgi:hypothetical protein